jgi:beta-N-acetylhexosaminidase
LGRVTANTDTSAGAVDERTTADDPALEPFRTAIAAGTTAVMVSSALYPRLDPDHIAAFSEPIITGLLRGQLHFDGLVISDDLGNAVAVSGVSVGRRAVDFVTAGGDMALTVQPTDFPVMLAALTDRAATSPEFRARVDDAALHVLASKETLGLLRC